MESGTVKAVYELLEQKEHKFRVFEDPVLRRMFGNVRIFS
jgi:hypothetical protein